MLFFVDESWQQVGDLDVGALGAVAIPQSDYNGFCREVFTWKRRVLGATELSDCEIKGTSIFAKAAFKARDTRGASRLLEAGDEMFHTLRKYHAKVFVVWTRHPSLLTLRNPTATALSLPYKKLLYQLRSHMRDRPGYLASLNFDQRSVKEDAATACAVSNFLVRTRGWRNSFMHVPTFTVSSVSPGLQAADLVAYLGAHFADESVRPELRPYLDRTRSLSGGIREARDVAAVAVA